MRLLDLRLENFRQHVDTRIHFPTGLIGIVGPNGAGKSTLLEAIAWALYGSDAARGTNDSIRHARATSRASVEVELRFALSGDEYRVLRTLSRAEVYVGGSDSPVATSLGGATEYLQARLGMVRREFFNTYFTSQKDLHFLSAMGPAERGRFLSTVLGYDRLRVAQELGRKRRNALKSRVEGLRSSLPDPEAVRAARVVAEKELSAADAAAGVAETAVREARERLEAIAPRWAGVQHARERFRELSHAIDAATAAVEAAGREVERMEGELRLIASTDAEHAALRQAIAALPELQERCDRLETLARADERRRGLAEQGREIDEELEASLDRLERLEQAPDLLSHYEEAVGVARAEHAEAARALEEARTAWLRDRQDAETRLLSYRDRLTELQEEIRRIDAAGADGLCPTCKRPLGEDFDRLKGSLEGQLAEVIQDGKWWRSRSEQLADRPAELLEQEGGVEALAHTLEELARKHTRCEAAVQELGTLREERSVRAARRDALLAEMAALPDGYDAREHAAATAELARLRTAEQRAAVLDGLSARRGEWEAAREEASERMRTAGAERDRARAEREALAFAEAAYEEVQREAIEAQEGLHREELAATGVGRRLDGARSTAIDAARAEAALDEQLSALDREVLALRHHNELDSAFTRLRGDLNARVRPELGEIASALLAQLTDGRYTSLEIDEAYNVVVLDEGRAKPVISGGEEDVTNLVLRLSLSRMIAERAGHPLSLLVLDEVFGSLDAARRDNVVRLLRRLRDRFEQVLVVTHLEEIRGALDQVLRVELDERNGRSVVTVES